MAIHTVPFLTVHSETTRGHGGERTLYSSVIKTGDMDIYPKVSNGHSGGKYSNFDTAEHEAQHFADMLGFEYIAPKDL